MLIKLDTPKIFADIITIISELVTEVKIKVNQEGMSLTAIDPSNISMVYFKIPAGMFSQFDVTNENILGINLESLKAILRRCKPGSFLVLEKIDNTLKVEIQDKIRRDFSLSLLDIDSEDKEMPNWEFNSVVKMDADNFVEVVEDCLVVSDACTFMAEPNRFVVEAHGLNSVKIDFSPEKIEIHSGNSIARYSLEYLNKFTKGAKISDRAILSFSTNHPLRVDFPTGNIMLSFILAPRIEQD